MPVIVNEFLSHILVATEITVVWVGLSQTITVRQAFEKGYAKLNFFSPASVKVIEPTLISILLRLVPLNPIKLSTRQAR